MDDADLEASIELIAWMATIIELAYGPPQTDRAVWQRIREGYKQYALEQSRKGGHPAATYVLQHLKERIQLTGERNV